jgi:vWA-MoxR associated protein C-terminal domain
VNARCETVPAVVPERVHALVVGVESYGVSTQWDLPGAAQDALRFAAWLTGSCKVPVANVRLLVSPLPHTDLGDVLSAPAGLREAVRSATQQNVEATLFDELPQLDGDLLWFFWAGHGFLDDRNQLLLPYADATSERVRHLNLESALRMWKSSRIPAGRFDKQVVIGDACRVHDRPGSKLFFDSHDYDAGQVVVDRRQFVLYASRAGEAAQNLAERAAGQFTELLLERLQVRTLEQTVTELVDIARAIQTDFRQLHQDGLAWQRPQFVIDRGWDGSTLFGDSWGSPPAGRSLRLDQGAWDQLGVVLRQRSLPPFTYEAYRWAFEVAGCEPPATPRLPAGGLMDLVRDLDSRQGGLKLPLALPFLRYLADRVNDPNWAAMLESWVATTRERLGAAAFPGPPHRSPRPMGMHIQLTEAVEDRTYWLRMWLHRDHFECIWAAEHPVDLAEARDHVGRQLHALYGGDAQHGPRLDTTGLKRLEFHVPFELLDEGFEHWMAPIGRAGRLEELGRQFEVVVRCPDERTGIARDHWLRKWKWFITHGGKHPDGVRLLCDEDAGRGRSKELHTDDPPVCVLAQVGTHHLTDVLSDMLDSGIPIAMWHRGGCSEVAPGKAGDLAAVVFPNPADHTAHVDLRELPAALHRLRTRNASAGQGSPLALLWDDPEFRPDPRSLA